MLRLPKLNAAAVAGTKRGRGSEFSRISCAAMCLSLATPAAAQTHPSSDITALRAEIEALRDEQRRAAERISQLEAALDAVQQAPAPPAAVVATSPTALAAPAPTSSPLDVSGDVRLRYEANFGDEDARGRNRGVLRARLRASYALQPWLTVGAQLTTGDADDPNSTDITLSNFDDDLQVSLDQAYAQISRGGLNILAAKMPQPFLRTDLVWDGDVSPQGVSAAYRIPLPGSAALKATGLYFLIDESVAGPDSDMIGMQIGVETAPGALWRAELVAGYYDYSLRNVAGADAGDFRSNLIGPDGRYLSDFDMGEGIAALTYQGLGPRWPIRLVGDYVKNLGAVAGDTGFQVDLAVGRASVVGDWRFGYGYAEAGVDAVLAAFSHDNTAIATNYIQHSFALDYVLRKSLILNATLYHYRPKDPLYSGSNDPHDWLNRVRLNLLMNF